MAKQLRPGDWLLIFYLLLVGWALGAQIFKYLARQADYPYPIPPET